jgi:hypothetical protein
VGVDREAEGYAGRCVGIRAWPRGKRSVDKGEKERAARPAGRESREVGETGEVKSGIISDMAMF